MWALMGVFGRSMIGKVNVPIQPKQFWNVHVGGTVWLEGRRCSAGEGYG